MTLFIVLVDFPQTSLLVLAKRGSFFCICVPLLSVSSAHQRTFRSVLRTQMKVQTDGLLLDLRTTNPPGPFSPLMPARAEREGQRRKQPCHYWLTGNVLRPDKATARRLAFVDGRHAGRHVAVAFALHPPDINKVPEKRGSSHSLGWSEILGHEGNCLLHWGTSQTQLLPLLRRKRHTTAWCCHQPSEGSEERADVTAASRAETSSARRQTWASVCQTAHLTGGNGSVPLHHLLWLQNHFLVNELSWTLHESLQSRNNSSTTKSCRLRCKDRGAGKHASALCHSDKRELNLCRFFCSVVFLCWSCDPSRQQPTQSVCLKLSSCGKLSWLDPHQLCFYWWKWDENSFDPVQILCLDLFDAKAEMLPHQLNKPVWTGASKVKRWPQIMSNSS